MFTASGGLTAMGVTDRFYFAQPKHQSGFQTLQDSTIPLTCPPIKGRACTERRTRIQILALSTAGSRGGTSIAPARRRAGQVNNLIPATLEVRA